MKYVVGIDLGGTFVKSAIIGEDEEIVSRSECPTGDNLTPENVVKTIAEDVEKNLDRQGIGKDDILGVGIGSPGPVNVETGVIEMAPNFKGWKNVPMRQMLSDELSMNVKLFNDASSAAYGEFWKGVGSQVSNFIMFTLGTGIGGGIILNNELYTGIDGSAAELGHLTLIPDGPECGCGNRGCLEVLASATAVYHKTLKGIEEGAETILRENYNDGTLTCKAVYIAATKGDEFATEILAETGRYLGIAAAWMINALNPEMIVYSGGLSGAGEYLFKWIRDEAKKRSLAVPYARVKIAPASLGNDAGFLGAAGLLLASL